MTAKERMHLAAYGDTVQMVDFDSLDVVRCAQRVPDAWHADPRRPRHLCQTDREGDVPREPRRAGLFQEDGPRAWAADEPGADGLRARAAGQDRRAPGRDRFRPAPGTGETPDRRAPPGMGRAFVVGRVGGVRSVPETVPGTVLGPDGRSPGSVRASTHRKIACGAEYSKLSVEKLRRGENGRITASDYHSQN